jgi:hypothetical protein
VEERNKAKTQDGNAADGHQRRATHLRRPSSIDSKRGRLAERGRFAKSVGTHRISTQQFSLNNFGNKGTGGTRTLATVRQYTSPFDMTAFSF